MPRKVKDPARLLTASEFRELLRISRPTFAEWKDAGLLPPAIVVRKRNYWRRSTVLAWLKKLEGAVA